MSIKDEIAGIRLDIEELKTLTDQAKRPKVRDFLSIELRRRETKLVELVEKEQFEEKKDDAKPVASQASCTYDSIVKIYCKEDTSMKSMKIVYFDLETTGINPKTRHEGIEICSIAAIHPASNAKFSQFWVPKARFQPGATKVNGMSVKRGKLFKNGEAIKEAIPLKEGLEEFLKFLDRKVMDGDESSPIVLVAHNNFKYDGIVLRKNLLKCGLKIPKNICLGDSMDLMRATKAKVPEMGSITLNNCLQVLVGKSQNEQHDALEDTLDLQRICDEACKRLGIPTIEEFFLKCSNTKSLANCY